MMRLNYPSILKQNIADGYMTYKQALLWMTKHGVRPTKARELLREASE